jgi:hypothetical protein
VELVFDSGASVYVVVGYPGHYYDRGRYYRRYDGRWEMSVALSGPWRVLAESGLPPGLRARTKRHGRKSWGPKNAPPAKPDDY